MRETGGARMCIFVHPYQQRSNIIICKYFWQMYSNYVRLTTQLQVMTKRKVEYQCEGFASNPATMHENNNLYIISDEKCSLLPLANYIKLITGFVRF